MFVNRKGFWKKLLSITICMVYIIILFVGQVGCFAEDTVVWSKGMYNIRAKITKGAAGKQLYSLA
jgi:hypothetical protein